MAINEAQHISVKFSLRYKLLIWFTLVFVAVFFSVFYWFYHYSVNTAKERLFSALYNTMVGTIDGINGDEFEALVNEAVPDESGLPAEDRRYQEHQDWLLRVHHLDPRAYAVYTYIPGAGPDDVLWIGDNYRVIEPETSTKWKESYTREPDSMILEGFIDLTLNRNIYTDPWGSHVSAYGPIKNSQGKVVGAVGIDMQSDEVITVERTVRTTFLGVGLIALAVLVLLVVIVSNILTKPIVNLTSAAQRIGEGDYNQDFSALTQNRTPDEIDVLAHNFAQMVDKVYQREQTLRRQVEELKIEIDEAKRSRAVSEIVDTDFFRDLQSKATRMRSRRVGGSAASDSSEEPAEE